jgi:U3 small nucleolar RNA-associated protein 3
VSAISTAIAIIYDIIFSDFAEPTAQVVKPVPQDRQTLIRHLEKTSPETLALARDWDDTAWNLIKSQAKIKKCVFSGLRFWHYL